MKCESNKWIMKKMFRKNMNCTLLEPGASEKRFYRLIRGERTILLCHFPDYMAIEKKNFLFWTKELKKNSFLVPFARIVNQDYLLIEDLGDNSIYRIYLENQQVIHKYLENILDCIKRLQSLNCDSYSRICQSYGDLRTSYINEVEKFANLIVETSDDPFWRGNISFLNELIVYYKKEEAKLFDKKPVLCFSDLQSKNIIIKDSKLYLIDFEGIKIGTDLLDLCSLVFDPYVHYSNEVTKKILECYVRKVGEFSLTRFHAQGVFKLLHATFVYYNMIVEKRRENYIPHLYSAMGMLKELSKVIR